MTFPPENLDPPEWLDNDYYFDLFRRSENERIPEDCKGYEASAIPQQG